MWLIIILNKEITKQTICSYKIAILQYVFFNFTLLLTLFWLVNHFYIIWYHGFVVNWIRQFFKPLQWLNKQQI
jgi:hypothetical protein